MSCWLALGNVCWGGIDVAGAVATASGQCIISECVLWCVSVTKKFGYTPVQHLRSGECTVGYAANNGGDACPITRACSRGPGFSAPPTRRGLPWQRHGPHFGPVAAHVCCLPAPRSALCYHLGPWPGPARGFRCHSCGPDQQGTGRALRPLEGHCLAAEPDLAGAWLARVRAGRAPPSSGLGCPDPGVSAAGRAGYPARSALGHEAIGG